MKFRINLNIKIFVFIIIFLCASTNQLNSWVTWVSERAKAVGIPTADGGYLIAFTSFGKLFIVKLYNTGTAEWERDYKIEERYDQVTSIFQDNDSCIFLSGESWILKISPEGIPIWQKIYAGVKILSIIKTKDFGLGVAGAYGNNAWVAKLNSQGNIIWQRTLGGLWGTDVEEALALQQTRDGGYLVIGYCKNITTNADQDIWLFKLDAYGHLEWQGAYGTKTNDKAYNVFEEDNGEILIAGTSGISYLPYFSTVIFIMKLFPDGSVKWQKAFPLSGGFSGYKLIDKTADGGYVFLSCLISKDMISVTDYYILKIDTNGNLLWQRKIFKRDTMLGEQESVNLIYSYKNFLFIMTSDYHSHRRSYLIKVYGTKAEINCEPPTISTIDISFLCEIPHINIKETEIIPKEVKDILVEYPFLLIGYSETDLSSFSVIPNHLSFGSIIGGHSTSSQTILLSQKKDIPVIWYAKSDVPWLAVEPEAGQGTTRITVYPKLDGLMPGNYKGFIVFSSPNATPTPSYVEVNLKIYGEYEALSPFGFLDTPQEGASGIEGAIAVTGWALDDIEVVKVEIKRDPHPLDNPVVIGPDGLVYIGDACFVEGARPDVEQAYPGYPLAYRAGWGYMLLTNFLPNQGNGTYRIHAIAYDKEGHRVTLGTKTFTSDNAHAIYPFGTIDTPSQGGQASGASYVNFGWALTPQPKYIPTDGSTILVWIDGLPQPGHPSYNHYRSDIAALFPGYANTNGAVGYYYLDTTKLTNGVHTIAWSVVDSAGVAAGIGSRYFTVVNSGAGGLMGDVVSLWGWGYREEGRKVFSISDLNKVAVDLSPIYVRRGYDLKAVAEGVLAEADGWFRLKMGQAERLEVMLDDEAREGREKEIELLVMGKEEELRKEESMKREERSKGKSREEGGGSERGKISLIGQSGLPSALTRYEGYLVVGEELRPLPVGSSFDPERGIFFWQPGPAFLGEYSFIFIREDKEYLAGIKKVKISIF